MNQNRTLPIAVVGLALGGLLGSVVYRTLQARAAGSKKGMDVVIAAHDIPAGDIKHGSGWFER